MSHPTGVFYVMSGPAHLPYLLVSLIHLRKHYDGPVLVYAWPETYGYVESIAKDRALRITPREWSPERRGKNAQFECKQQVAMSLADEFGKVIYLDADTMPMQSPEYLTRVMDHPTREFVATQFNEWESSGKLVRTRVGRLRGIPSIPGELLDSLSVHPWPSVNGGVFACRPKSFILSEWHALTRDARSVFISDECVLHVMVAKYSNLSTMKHETPLFVWRGGDSNASPKYWKSKRDRRDHLVRMWHFHGDCNVRPKKSEKAVRIWWPQYQEAISNNSGNAKDWIGEVAPQNKFLSNLIADPPDFVKERTPQETR